MRVRLSPLGTKRNHHLPRLIPVHCTAALLRRQLKSCSHRVSAYEFNLIYRDVEVARVIRHNGVLS